MPSGRFRLIRIVPGAAAVQPHLAEFARRGGIVTSLDDDALPWIHGLVGELEGRDAVSVLPFGETVGRLMSCGSVDSLPIAQSGLVLAAVEAACEAQPEGSPFFATKSFPGLHRRVRDTLDELNKWNVGVDELRQAASEEPEPFAGKLRALADIGERTIALLRKLGRTSNADRMRACLGGQIDPEAAPPALLIVAGNHDHPVLADWLHWAQSVAPELTVLVESHAGGAPLFRGAARLAAALQADAEPPKASGLADALFTPRQTDANVQVASAGDSLSEVEWALRGCAERMADGVPATSLAIFARNLERAAPFIEAAAKRFGVPVSIARRMPVLQNRLARLIADSLAFCAGSDVRALVAIASSSYLGLTGEQRAALAQAVKEAYVSQRQWDGLVDWAQEQAESYPWLVDLLAWREEALENPRSLREWERMLDGLGDALTQGRFADGSPTSERDSHAQSALQRALSQRASVEMAKGPRPWSLEAFSRKATQLWETEECTVPALQDGISVVGSARALGQVDTVFAIGMLEGVFPRRRTEDPILTDEERRQLAERLGREYLPNSHSRAAEERDEFYRLCTAPQSRLVLSYAMTQEDRDNVPAFYLAEVRRAVGKELGEDFPLFGPPLAEAQHPIDKRLALALTSPARPVLPNELSSEEARSFVRGRPGQGYTPRDLRRCRECPFQFAFSTRLGIRTKRDRNRWFRLLQLPLAARLYAQATEEDAVEAMQNELDQLLASLYGEVQPHELTILRADGNRLIRGWVQREFAARKTWPRDDDSLNLSPKFGAAGLKPDLDFGKDGRVALRGELPALSRHGQAKVLHMADARNYTLPRDGEALEELDQLELGTYLLAMHEGGTPLAIEIDSMAGDRRIRFVLPRDQATVADVANNLTVFDLGNYIEFLRGARKLVLETIHLLDQGSVKPTPGDACTTCDYGELCRTSKEFGDEIDPFGEDDVPL